jgi:hypothetical protein
MTLPPPKICRRIRQLHASMGSPNAHEAATAREKLTKLLAEYSLTWNDLPTILAASEGSAGPTYTSARPAGRQTASSAPEVNVLDLVLRLIELHIAIAPEERMAVALWILHSYVFDRFTITPRLALLSPVRGCGKTTLLVLLELLVAEPYRVDDITAAAIYHQLDRRPRTTLLIDEGDNLGLLSNRVLRSVFNSGHRKGGGISRFVSGWPRKFQTFAPLAVAAIGYTLPLPLMHRAAAVINMQRYAPGEAQIQQLDENDPSLGAAREQIRRWVATRSLARNPKMPPSLRNRAADNWRVLFAIADDLGHGEDARAAAIALSARRLDEDPGVVLLGHTRRIFLARGIDRIASAALIEALLELDDSPWGDWRGPQDDRPSRKLSQEELARLLRPFGIRPGSVWPVPRHPGAKSAKGYLRSQFEAAWAAYCPAADTPAQDSKVVRIGRQRGL